MSQSIFEQYDIFKTMHPVKLQVMKELMENGGGKSMKDMAPQLMNASAKLKQSNLSFTPEEVGILIEVLSKDMSAEEKVKVEMMKKFMQKKR